MTNQAALSKTAHRNLVCQRFGKVGAGTMVLLEAERKERGDSMPRFLAKLAVAARLARLEGKHMRKVLKNTG